MAAKVSSQLGGDEKLKQLQDKLKEVKKMLEWVKEEEKPSLSSLYDHLSQIYSKIRDGLRSSEPHTELNPEIIDQLQMILSGISERKDNKETTEETQEEGGAVSGEGGQMEK